MKKVMTTKAERSPDFSDCMELHEDGNYWINLGKGRKLGIYPYEYSLPLGWGGRKWRLTLSVSKGRYAVELQKTLFS
jgi:hypothetical protein